jgi:hypothetical protein
MDRGLYLTDYDDYDAHAIHYRGEQQLLGVLLTGVRREYLVDRLRRQSVLHRGSSHDADWGLLDEPIDNLGEQHRPAMRSGPAYGNER